MNILMVMVPIAILLAAGAVYAFTWAIRSGQYEDTETPAIRMLWDDEETNIKKKTS
ncbi:MAG TPA: cbb3-type cytochrome oxidase assembly protein CcoS [Bacteroidetes bacterium]|nr:cbb3-type cytochrome oxidase assembly protein CcoS [Bacteroidota bacterium]